MQTVQITLTDFTIGIWCENCKHFCDHEVSFEEIKQEEVTYKKKCSLCDHTQPVKVPKETWQNILRNRKK